MFYPQEIIEEIRIQNDIVDVVSQYVNLKQRGNTYKGLCPFHNEKTPSFSVSSEKQIYHCFACGEGGNVYRFVMKMENIDFVETVKMLAGRVNLELPETNYSEEAKKQFQLKESIYEIHKTAARFYYQTLIGEGGAGTLAYLSKRGITQKTLKKFGLGFSPEKRTSLFQHLKANHYTTQAIVKSGLVIEDQKSGNYYDRFFKRLMFPIFDIQGRVIAFGGRIMAEGEPKYLNSSDTVLFDKGKNLYGLNYARVSKNKSVIIVEGYMDVLALYQAGFTNVCAALGTAFTQEHARILRKYFEETIILFDSDAAGEKAALRAIPFLVNAGLRVKVLQVKDAKDPDEFVKAFGAEAFGNLLATADNYIAFQVNCIRKRYNIQNIDEKVLLSEEVKKLLAGISSQVEREIYIKEIAANLGIEPQAFKNDVEKLDQEQEQAQVASRLKKETLNKPSFNKSSFNKTTLSKVAVQNPSKSLGKAQVCILYYIVTHTKFYPVIKKYIAPTDFLEESFVHVANVIFSFIEKNQAIYPAELMNYFEGDQEQKLIAEIFSFVPQSEDQNLLQKEIEDNIKVVKTAQVNHAIEVAKKENDMMKITTLIDSRNKINNIFIKFI